MKFSALNAALLSAASLAGSASAFVLPSSSVAATAVQLKSTNLLAKARGEGYGPPLDNISEAVGNTPMVKLSDRTCPAGR